MLTKLRITLLLTILPLSASITSEVREAAMAGRFDEAQAKLAAFKQANGESAEYIQAYSWLARGALNQKRYGDAVKFAVNTKAMALSRLKASILDDDRFLPTALGASIEVKAQAMAAQGDRNAAVAYLNQQLALYRNTSIRARIQKNINLLSLTGKPAPALETAKWLGPKPPSLASLRGKPVLLFFWAHWCPDCRHEIPTIARIKEEFAPKGLVVMGPTQLYGYAQGGEDAPPDKETAYIEQVRTQVYGSLLDVPVPLSQENFKVYGVSTTPTLTLIDRGGRVTLYHPGTMDYRELAAAVTQALTAPPARRPPASSHAPGRGTRGAGSHTSATHPSNP